MASIGYDYEPEETDSEFPENDDGVFEDEICYSTKLEELDRIDLINRNSDELNQTINPEIFTPDPLGGKSLFVKTIPEGGVKTYEPQVVDEIIRDREESINDLTVKENENIIHGFEKKKLHNMSVKDFIKFLADSYLNVINDLLEINSIDDFLDVFIKEDRLVAIGVLFLAISIFFIFFNNI